MGFAVEALDLLCYAMAMAMAMLCYALLQQQSCHPAPPSLAWISHALPLCYAMAMAMLCYGYAMLCFAAATIVPPRAPFSCLDLSCSSPHPLTLACIVPCCAMLRCTHNSHVKRVADRHNAHEEGNETSSINITKEFVCAMLCYAVLSYVILCYADVTC